MTLFGSTDSGHFYKVRLFYCSRRRRMSIVGLICLCPQLNAANFLHSQANLAKCRFYSMTRILCVSRTRFCSIWRKKRRSCVVQRRLIGWRSSSGWPGRQIGLVLACRICVLLCSGHICPLSRKRFWRICVGEFWWIWIHWTVRCLSQSICYLRAFRLPISVARRICFGWIKLMWMWQIIRR